MKDSNKDAPKNDDSHDTLGDDWAAAMSEQEQAGVPQNQAQGLGTHHQDSPDAGNNPDTDSGEADDWAAALAEQTAAESASSSTATSLRTKNPVSASPAPDLFQPLTSESVEGQSDIDMIRDIPVQMSVELGRTRLTIKNILQLGQGSVVELDGLAGEPMDIYVNGYLIAQGEVVVVDEKYGIRVTDIITPSDRINRLSNRR